MIENNETTRQHLAHLEFESMDEDSMRDFIVLKLCEDYKTDTGLFTRTVQQHLDNGILPEPACLEYFDCDEE